MFQPDRARQLSQGRSESGNEKLGFMAAACPIVLTNFDIFFVRERLQLSPFYYDCKFAGWFCWLCDRISCWERLY